MHLVGVARVGPRFFAHRLDGSDVERTEILGGLRIAPAAHLHGLGASFLQRGIVEEGVGSGAENLGGERRRLDEVAREDVDGAAFQAAQDAEQTFDIHRLVQAVVEGLRDQRVVGNLALADDVFQAGHLIRKHAGEQVLGAHALQLRRDLLAAGEARQGQRGGRRPAPAHAENGCVEQGLDEDILCARRMQVARHLDQRKTVAGRQRQDDRVLGGGGLQFEVEGAAEALAQGQAPGLVDAAAEGRVDDQLGAAGFVEEALHDDALARRQGAERVARAGQVVDRLLRSDRIDADLFYQPTARSSDSFAFSIPDSRFSIPIEQQELLDLLAQARHADRELVAATGRLGNPERDARRQPVRIFDAQQAAFDAQDAIAGIAELEDVAGHALDGKILVHAADGDRLGLDANGVVGGVGNRAAGGQCGQARIATPAQLAVHGVAMQIAGAGAALGAEAFAEHAHHGVEIRA